MSSSSWSLSGSCLHYHPRVFTTPSSPHLLLCQGHFFTTTQECSPLHLLHTYSSV
jgi:hypothetical protein